ncbi:MAG: S8 family serine peptidase, partial [Planctomycetota bacterium]
LLLFGSTNCPHCQGAFDLLNQLENDIGDELKIYFIALKQNKNQVIDHFSDKQRLFDILIDQDGVVAQLFGIKRLPTTIFIDDHGLIQYTGRPNEDMIWRLLSGERLTHSDKLPPGFDPNNFIRRQKPDSEPINRFIVELDEKKSRSKKLTKAAVLSRRAQFNKTAKSIGAKIIHNYGKWENKIVVQIPPADVNNLRQIPGFKSVTPDRRVHALLEDSTYQIKADYAWDNAITGQGVKVCVVDTGIDYTHPDLVNKVIAQHNFSFGGDPDDAMDDHGHGTHCAGIIASEGTVYRGVSHDVALMGVKVLDKSGDGYASDVVLGVNWCVDQGADIISLSLGEGLFSGTCDEDLMAVAVNHAVDPCGVVVVCASGNDGNPNAMVAPSCASKAIAVGAVDKLDNIASYSDGGTELDLVAPGGDILGGQNYPEIVSCYSTLVANNPEYCMYLIADICYDNYLVVDGSRYIKAEGTSMATPHVAGAAALLLEENPYLTATQIKTVLEENADDFGTPGWDNVFGWGRVNLEKAFENIPPELAELKVTITEPNATDTFIVDQQFDLLASIDCFGGDGCGEVLVHAQFCEGLDCNDFADINATTAVVTFDENPNDLGILSGYTLETDVNVSFDAQTMLDISEQSYTKTLNSPNSLVGSTLPGEYNTGDLEPQDGVGAIGQNVEAHYEFEVPPGVIKTIKVRMENYLVMHFNYPPFAAWEVYTSNSDGNNLHIVAECIPAEGGGGETPSPDCWFISDDPNVLSDITPGATNYIKLVSRDVGEFDWITFNDIEVIIEFEADPNNDEVYRYYVKYDLTDIDPGNELTAARLKIHVSNPVTDAIAELNLTDNSLLSSDSALLIHESNSPAYSSLINPIKSFSAENAVTTSLNIKAAVEEAIAAGQDYIAFSISEYNNDQLVTLDANDSSNPPTLTISQKVLEPTPPSGGEVSEPNNGPRSLVYDTVIVKDVNDDTYVKYDNPTSAVIGAAFDSEYQTGDLEPNDGIGAIGQNATKLYEFELPAGIITNLKVRMEHYLVMHFDYPPFATWEVYTSNSGGSNLHIVAECVPAEGGGGTPVPPDCWFVSDDPNVLADLNPGGTNYIRLASRDVGENDWLTFNDIEVIAEYQIDPNNDSIHRYYVKFDIASLSSDAKVDSAKLNVYVTEPNDDAVAEIYLTESTYDPCTAGYMIYNTLDAGYSSLTNPIKTFSAGTVGLKQINVKSALEDALASGVPEIAFLIAEQNENALFTIDANGGAQPPVLNVYFKSGISGGLSKWNIMPGTNGKFTLRVKATNNVGVSGLSDALVINVYDPNLPVIESVECLINSTWQDCRNAQYGDNLQSIRIDASDPQEDPNVWLTLRNIPDDHNFVDSQLTSGGGYYTSNPNLTIGDSGSWQINVTATDSDENVDIETITWNIPWGSLDSYLINPLSDITAAKSSGFDVEVGVQCLDAECPDVNFGLVLNKPHKLIYDDYTAESWGDMNSTDMYLAVKLTPDSYPAQVNAARFYIWDETTYPFELNIWDDNGKYVDYPYDSGSCSGFWCGSKYGPKCSMVRCRSFGA